ncbi:DDE-type integrase/transposase/recombinase [Cupriavidus numazuensis]|uniref:Integrase catalytic domain-containing protein n=1 Tax=Cupriavidus numazuensis TaxID=221992 RepID=A0ABM8TSA6_9BURK|nr:DDE-type integrase/transposase/recombinase [Cupriavidus numazuensis]CAG2159212.1 hypothetical protein LMG26411_06525 [Cupriavidus numazuensis]
MRDWSTDEYPIAENLVLRETETGYRYVVVFRGGVSLHTVLERIDVADQWPISLERSKVTAAIKSGKFKVDYSGLSCRVVHLPNYYKTDSPTDTGSVAVDADTKLKDKQSVDDARWKLIEDIVETEEYFSILYGIKRTHNIDKLAREFCVSRQHITKILKLYWRNGLNKAAVQSDLDNCGGPGKPRNSKGDRRLGGPRRYAIEENLGQVSNEETRRHLQVAADYYLHLKKKKVTYQQAIDYIVGLYYTTKIVANDGTLEAIEIDSACRPTVRQLQHYINTNYPLATRKRSRATEKEWELMLRGLEGRATDIAHGPGERFQIDATVANIYIISRIDRRFVVCRPTIYFVVDTWSRLIVGIHVGLEPPSWIAAMMALVNCVEDKVEYCHRYGIEIDRFQWPSAHLPACLLADKAELLSIQLGKDIVDYLRVRIDNAPGGRPDLKPIVERRFGIYESPFGPFLPGYVERNWGERGVPDPRKSAALDLDQFTCAVILAVIEHNTCRVIAGYEPPPEMVGEGLPAIPYMLWHWGIANVSGELSYRSPDEVRMCVYPEVDVAITEHGIEYGGNEYTSPTCHSEGWPARARQKGIWHLKGRCNINRLGDLYVPVGHRNYEPCKIKHPGNANFALSERCELEYRMRDNAAKGRSRTQAGRVAGMLAQQEIQSEAERQTGVVLASSGLRQPIVKHMRDVKSAEQAYTAGRQSTAPAAIQSRGTQPSKISRMSLLTDSKNRKSAKIQAKINALISKIHHDE